MLKYEQHAIAYLLTLFLSTYISKVVMCTQRHFLYSLQCRKHENSPHNLRRVTAGSRVFILECPRCLQLIIYTKDIIPKETCSRTLHRRRNVLIVSLLGIPCRDDSKSIYLTYIVDRSVFLFNFESFLFIPFLRPP